MVKTTTDYIWGLLSHSHKLNFNVSNPFWKVAVDAICTREGLTSSDTFKVKTLLTMNRNNYKHLRSQR